MLKKVLIYLLIFSIAVTALPIVNTSQATESSVQYKTRQVTSAKLLVRSSKSSDSAKLGIVRQGDIFTGVKEGAWFKTTYKGQTAYMAYKYTGFVDVNIETRYVSSNQLIIRPSKTSTTRLGIAKKGDKFIGTREGAWFKTTYKGQTAYIAYAYTTSNISTKITDKFSYAIPLGFMATGVDTRAVLSWEPLEGAQTYEIFESRDGANFNRISSTKYLSISLSNKIRGNDYLYKIRGKKVVDGTNIYSKYSETRTVTIASTGKSTIKTLLQTGLAPMGSTMYVWGGGWNKPDTGSGPTTMRIGLTPGWRTFYNKQTSSYNHWNYKFDILKGLDCSGFIGFIAYNAFEYRHGNAGYVDFAEFTGPTYSKKGLGTYDTKKNYTDLKAGDVLYNRDHVYMIVGQESDGSAVIIHSSPSGVKLGGTPTRSGNKDSEAVRVATQYMKKYYPDFYNKYGKIVTPTNYLTAYNKFKWSESVVSDPHGYRQMSGSEVLEHLFNNR